MTMKTSKDLRRPCHRPSPPPRPLRGAAAPSAPDHQLGGMFLSKHFRVRGHRSAAQALLHPRRERPRLLPMQPHWDLPDTAWRRCFLLAEPPCIRALADVCRSSPGLQGRVEGAVGMGGNTKKSQTPSKSRWNGKRKTGSLRKPVVSGSLVFPLLWALARNAG